MSPDFHVDDPRNLAPICARCNGKRGKHNKDYSDVPRTMDLLHRAEDLRSRVIDEVMNFSQSGDIAKALIKANVSNLKDPKVRRAFERHASAIVQKVALLGEEKADFTTIRTADLQIGDYSVDLRISLNARGRTTLTILAEVCGVRLEDVARTGLADLLGELYQDLQYKVENLEEYLRTEAGPQEVTYLGVHFEAFDFQRVADTVKFMFEGNVESQSTYSVVRDSEDGGGLDWLQSDAYQYLTITKSATWDPKTSGDTLDIGDYAVVQWMEHISTA